MGSSSSKTTSVTNVFTETITNISTTVINRNSTVTSVSQTMNITCDKELKLKMAAECSQTIKGVTDPEILKAITDSVICEDPCSVSDITQNSMVTISMDSINNNSLANDLKTDLLSKLDKQISDSKGAPIFTDSKTEVDTLTTIRNEVNNNFDFKVVNETIKEFNFNQILNIDSTNAYNIKQELVANMIAKNVMTNLTNTSTDFKNAIEALEKAVTEQTSLMQDTGEAAAEVVHAAGDAASGVIDSAGGAASGVIDSTGNALTGMFDSMAVLGVIAIILFLLYIYIKGKSFFTSSNDNNNQKNNNQTYQQQPYNNQNYQQQPYNYQQPMNYQTYQQPMNYQQQSMSYQQ